MFLLATLPYDASGVSAFISMPQGDQQATSEERRLAYSVAGVLPTSMPFTARCPEQVPALWLGRLPM